MKLMSEEQRFIVFSDCGAMSAEYPYIFALEYYFFETAKDF
jgi:hypothetical protein